jgi:hypothetical protein
MGIWGYGNFERDDSLNVLGDLFEHIIQDIRETFSADSEKSLYDDFGESHIVANIDILITLFQHYRSYPSMNLEEIAKWKQDYLSTYDRTIHEYSDSIEYINQRRQVIIDTFDQLYRIIRDEWGDD